MLRFAKLVDTVEVVDDSVTVQDFARSKITSSEREDDDNPFYVCDIGEITKKWKMFRELLPQVEPFYGVKCNPESALLQFLADIDVNFRCASEGEIRMVADMGVSSERIIFANSCKQMSHIRYAGCRGVNMMTFDCQEELGKIKEYHADAELMMRINLDVTKSHLGNHLKEGLSGPKHILDTAWKLNLNVVGVSADLGTRIDDPSKFYEAMRNARYIFEQGREVGYIFTVLDIAGDFPSVEDGNISFEECALKLSYGLTDFFPPSSGVRVIAETSRYLVSSAFTFVGSITSIREKRDYNSEVDFQYLLNEGCFGCFNFLRFQRHILIPYPLSEEEKEDCSMYLSSVWGPTFNSMECISSSVSLPKMNIGDWICFDNMGAYTTCYSTYYDSKPVIMYMCHQRVKDTCPYKIYK